MPKDELCGGAEHDAVHHINAFHLQPPRTGDNGRVMVSVLALAEKDPPTPAHKDELYTQSVTHLQRKSDTRHSFECLCKELCFCVCIC